MKAQELLSQTISYSNSLNAEIWDGDQLRPEVRQRLLKIAKFFADYLNVPNFKLVNVLLRGSMANYNYTRHSDIDLHLVTNYQDLNCDIAEEFYKAKKTIWNDQHNITIYGYDVEAYVEDIDEINISDGTYSILNNQWVKHPQHRPPKINSGAVLSKAQSLMHAIDTEIAQRDADELEKIFDKIKKMRKSGLDQGGEFSTENLAFKLLRNQGYIDRLVKIKTAIQDKKLSLG